MEIYNVLRHFITCATVDIAMKLINTLIIDWKSEGGCPSTLGTSPGSAYAPFRASSPTQELMILRSRREPGFTSQTLALNESIKDCTGNQGSCTSWSLVNCKQDSIASYQLQGNPIAHTKCRWQMATITLLCLNTPEITTQFLKECLCKCQPKPHFCFFYSCSL